MIRNRFCVRLCGIGLLLLLTPFVALAQTSSNGGGGGTGTGVAAPGGDLATGVGTSGGGGGGGAGGGGTAEGVKALTTLTTKTPLYSANSGSTGTATSIPSNANYLGNNMVLPMSLGLPSLYATQFGAQNVLSSSGGPKGKFTYLYVAPPTATTTATATQQQKANGFTTYGQIRSPVYQTAFSDQIPIVQHNIGDLHTRVRETIQSSSRLAGKGNFEVRLEGGTIVLTGTANSAHERQLAEGLARITPGVNGVPLRNDILVPQTINK